MKNKKDNSNLVMLLLIVLLFFLFGGLGMMGFGTHMMYGTYNAFGGTSLLFWVFQIVIFILIAILLIKKIQE